jgi:hypothetical protein
MKSLLILACIILFACHERKKEAVDKAIRTKELAKGHQLDSYLILRTTDTMGIYTVYYQAELSPGSGRTEIQDSIRFYVTGDGLLQMHP